MNNLINQKVLLKLSYDEIENINHWVHPNRGGISIDLFTKSHEEINIVISSRAVEDYFPEDPRMLIPGRIYINSNLIELQSEIEQRLIEILKKLIEFQRLGHPKGLGVFVIQEVISFYTTKNAFEFSQKLIKKQES